MSPSLKKKKKKKKKPKKLKGKIYSKFEFFWIYLLKIFLLLFNDTHTHKKDLYAKILHKAENPNINPSLSPSVEINLDGMINDKISRTDGVYFLWIAS